MTINRRELIGLAAGAGATLGLGASGGAQAQGIARPRQSGQISEGRIDFHQHIMPPGYADWLEERVKDSPFKITFPQPQWSPESAIAANDALGNQGSYVSVSSPGIQFGNIKQSREYARRCNEYVAKFSSDRPDRFGWFAVLVLPDVEGSIAEAVYALDVLKADGVVVLANAWGGVYMGHPSFDPLMEELNKRKTIMFVHPTDLWNSVHMDVAAPPYLDFLLDTTRAAVYMAKRRIPTLYPDLKIILSHGAGFIPYHAQRVAVAAQPLQPSATDTPNRAIEELQKFYFDITSAMTPYAMPSILAFAKPTHILTGFDFPHAGLPGGINASKNFDAMPLTDEVRAAIMRENGLRLSSRFAKKPA